MDNQLFPSYVWANANRGYLSQGKRLQYGPDYYGDSEGQIGIKVTNFMVGTPQVKVVVSAPEIMERSEFTCTITGKAVQLDIFPEIRYKWDVLAKWRQPKPQNVSIAVYVDGQLSREENLVITVRSINDCPFLFIHRKGFAHDMNFMYAAYVNENHPRIDREILPAILKKGIIDKVTGYQGDANEVFAQVFAVWQYLRAKGIAYSSLTSQVPHLNSEFPLVMSQYVRTFDDALGGGQANCVDGTVLMASILYRMGLKPLIVTTPNHCFLGVMTDPKTTNLMFVETTMLNMSVSNQLADQMSKEKLCNKSVYYSLIHGNDYYSFAAAVLTGQKNFEEIQGKVIANSEYYGIQVDKTNVAEVIAALQYQLYEVEKYRGEGLLPLVIE